MKEEKSVCTCRASGCQSAVAVARRQLAGGVHAIDGSITITIMKRNSFFGGVANLLSLMNILEVEGCVHRVCSALTNGHNNCGTLLFKKLVPTRPHNLHSPQQSTAEQIWRSWLAVVAMLKLSWETCKTT
jgi:hypothetical protein